MRNLLRLRLLLRELMLAVLDFLAVHLFLRSLVVAAAAVVDFQASGNRWLAGDLDRSAPRRLMAHPADEKILHTPKRGFSA